MIFTQLHIQIILHFCTSEMGSWTSLVLDFCFVINRNLFASGSQVMQQAEKAASRAATQRDFFKKRFKRYYYSNVGCCRTFTPFGKTVLHKKRLPAFVLCIYKLHIKYAARTMYLIAHWAVHSFLCFQGWVGFSGGPGWVSPPELEGRLLPAFAEVSLGQAPSPASAQPLIMEVQSLD